MSERDLYTGLTDDEAVLILVAKRHGETDESLAKRLHLDERAIYNLRLGRARCWEQYERVLPKVNEHCRAQQEAA